MRRWVWLALAFAALLWPGRALSSFDGIPLDRPLEALAIGLIVPALAWLSPSFIDTIFARVLVVVLLVLKLGGTLVLTQGGLCGQFRLDAPLHGTIPKPSDAAAQSIPVEEPDGVLHSWDGRADWRIPAASCSAIVARSYETQADFPAWFLNLVRNVDPPRTDVTLRLTGFIRTSEPGTLTVATGRSGVAGQVGGQIVTVRGGTARVDLPAGVQPVDLALPLRSDDWRLVARWNGRDSWSSVLTTVQPPTRLDTVLWRAGPVVVVFTVLLLVVTWIAHAWRALDPGWTIVSWVIVASFVLGVVAMQGRFARLSGLVLFAAAFVPVPHRLRRTRGAFLLVGVAWLAFFAALSFPQIGRFTLYSGDDWLTYQVAGHRIFMGGYWLEGGNPVFNYQPLYRWMSGGIHMVFGDSSVGETYWDAACLLMGALLSFRLVDELAGFRAGIIAAAATLATFTLGPIWYFVGRGLSEVAAAGWGFIAVFCLVRAREGRLASAMAAGLFAVLMFYTRLNHLVFMFALVPVLVPAAVSASWPDAFPALRQALRRRAGLVYGVVLVAGVALFALRTWRYTGVFSLFHGTSLALNDTGLRLTTIGSAEVWRRVAHSLLALVWMNEPPRPDPRALLVAFGAIAAWLAVLQVPKFRTLPFGLSTLCVAATLSSLLAHTHNYPGRLSIHLVPFAVAMSVVAAARVSGIRAGIPAASVRRVETSAG